MRLLLSVVLLSCVTWCDAVDGQWSAWDTCDQNCGGGVMRRTCTNPQPTNGGNPCGGLDFDYCNTQSCNPAAGGVVLTVTLAYRCAHLNATNVAACAGKFQREVMQALHEQDLSTVDVLDLYEVNLQTVVAFELDLHNGAQTNQNNAKAFNDLINRADSEIHNAMNFPMLSTVQVPPPAEAKWYNNLTSNPVFWVVLWGSVVLLLVLIYCRFCYCKKRMDVKQERKDQEELKQNYIRLQEAEDRNAPLPSNWVRKYDREKKEKYYYNSVTHETSVDRPIQ